MKVVVEFYRTRQQDAAQAIVGRETLDAVDLDDALQMAKRLLVTLDMPQQPDAMTIVSWAGIALFSGAIEE